MSGFCFSCGISLNSGLEVGRRDECPNCHADIHVCKNCLFYDLNSYNECREPQADVVKEKDRSNFCDYFQLNSKGSAKTSNNDDLKAQAEALFKNLGKK